MEILENILLEDLPALMKNLNIPLKTHVRVVIEEIETQAENKRENLSDHPAFGMWADRGDMKDPAAYVRKLREPRYKNAY